MDRVLLGKSESGKAGLWVSKPGVNVIAYAGNTYFDDMYGLNQNFKWSGEASFNHNFVGILSSEHPQTEPTSTANGTLLLSSYSVLTTGAAKHNPNFIYVMNTSPNWTSGFYAKGYRSHLKDTSFHGATYPLLEFRIRRPQLAPGLYWDDTYYNALSDNKLFWFFGTSNTTHPSLFSTTEYAGVNIPSLDNVFGTTDEWVTFEYDFENQTYSWQRDGGVSGSGPLTVGTGGIKRWTSDTYIHALMFGPLREATSSTTATRLNAPDFELDYVRAKKRGVPMNFGVSIQDQFSFSSDWEETGLVHQTGTVTIGNEYAWANGTSKESGTSHPGSTSGHVTFPKLPYIPVVLFQRMDSDNPNISFPGGDKEFSFAHCDMNSNIQVWNPLTKQYQTSTNTSYGSEYRTFAYARAGYDGFDLTCRNAIARDGFEWLFNYTPQEPYIEIYKGGNYDPETENPETFVMYPQTRQQGGAPTEFSAGDSVPAVDNGLFSNSIFDAYRSPLLTEFYGYKANQGKTEINNIIQDLSTLSIHEAPLVKRFGDELSVLLTNQDTTKQTFGDEGVNGRNHAVGYMKSGVLGVRRGKIFKQSDLPDDMQYHDANNIVNEAAGFTGAAGYHNDINTVVVNNAAYIFSGTIASSPQRLKDGIAAHDWSARDHMDGKLGYFAKYTGMDKGNCLPTFDWANKFGDWNVPQFNNFYQYIPEIGVGSYTSFKDAIGTSWTEENTKFLDDSMWLGYANNRFEYKGDIWHPQAPTKTYDELSGMFGYGGTIAHQGDWHDFAGSNTAYLWNFNNMIDYDGFDYYFNGSEPYPRRDSYKSFPGHGYLGIHAVSRFDSNTLFNDNYRNAENGPFAADVQFRNRYMYRPFNGVGASRVTRYGGGLGFSGPGTQVTYGRLHDYGRTQINSYTESALGLNSGIDYYSNIRIQNGDLTTYNYPKRWNLESVLPSPKYWTDSSDDNQFPRDTVGLLPSLEEQQSGYNAHKDSFVVSRWYTYPGATFSYDISNFSGPAHYDAWYKNDVTKETNDYKRKDYPQLYTGGWGNYGYFPTQEQLDQGKGATRLFPIRKDQYGVNLTDHSSPVGNPNPHGYGSFPPADDPYYVRGGAGSIGTVYATYVYTPAQFPPYDNLGFAGSDIQGPFTIFKKRDMLYGSTLPVRPKTISYDKDTVYLYFKPNHLHEEKQISKTFGIPNEIAGDYYVASTVHNERGANPQVVGSTGVVDAFHSTQGTLSTNDGQGWHTKHYNSTLNVPAHIGVYGEDSWRHGMPYYHPVYNAGFFAEEMNRTTYPDYKLNNYLLSKGIDVNTLAPGDPIPIKADPYFAGMAFEGCNKITGAFTAHRFEFIIKKTKTHINHFRQSYEYNLPGRSGHRADTLRPIGYGLVSGVTGFDSYHGPPPAAHSYFDGRQLSGGHPYWRDAGNVNVDGVDEVNFYITTQLYEDSPQNNKNTLRAAFGTLYRSHDDGTICDQTIAAALRPATSHPAYNTTEFPNGGWGNALQEVKYDIDFYVDDADSETIKSAQLGGKYAFTGFGNAGFPAQFSQMNSLTSFVPGDVEDRIFTYGGYNPNAGISGGFLIPFFYAATRGPDELGGFGYQEDPAVYSPFTNPPITDHNYDTTAHEMQQGARLSVSISRHGRDQMYRNIIGAVEVANTYFADYKATYWTGSQLRYWITGSTAVPSPPTNNDYYNLGRPLSYRPAKSQGASPETQMYGAYLGAPFNRYSDYHKAWAGLNSNWLSNGNHWEDDILPGMCKADNALTNWGTVDLSKFDHNHIGYKWHNDAWYDADSAGLAESIIWSPNKVNVRFNEAGKGGGADPASGVTKRTPNQKGGCYDGFKLHERPEFQPVSGDGRYFGGVGGVDNWGGTSYNTWGPGMSVSPTVWDLKWTSIQHPFGVAPTEAQNANQFYGATSVWNQTSYIGGAPNFRFTIGDNGDAFKYSDGTSPTTTTFEGTSVSAGSYIDPSNPFYSTLFKGSTPQNYEWAIGGSQIQCNHWDRTLKVPHLEWKDNSTGRNLAHANNGIQPLVSLKVKGAYDQGGRTWLILENNGLINDVSDFSDWLATDEIVLRKGNLESASANLDRDYTTNIGNPNLDYTEGILIYTKSTFPGGVADGFAPIRMRLKPILGIGIAPTGSDFYDDPNTVSIDQNPQLVVYNKTLAEDPTRHPAGSFRANTTYHFQYAYNSANIKPPEYRYWVLRIPASMDAYNGESLI